MNTPILQDLKLTILNSTTLYPSKPTENRSIFLSDIDQTLNFDMNICFIFTTNPHFPSTHVTESLKSAIQSVLVPYDFLAGRLRRNEKDHHRLEINCNAAGIGFAVAATEFKLNEIGELDHPHQAFQQLAFAISENLKMEERPLCSFQLTFFNCGGFALCMTSNHIALDGTSIRTFLDNIAALATCKTLAAQPVTDRRLLSARNPPKLSFPHPEIIDPSALPPFQTDLETKLFRVDATIINELKRRAEPASCQKTRFKVLAAHLWRCKTRAEGVEPSSTSTLCYIVDIRARLRPALAKEYVGNAVLCTFARAKAGDLAELPLWRVVELVSEGEMRIGDEYARSVIDCMFVRRGIAYVEGLAMSSWLWLGLGDVEYPWGRPVYVCPVGRAFCEMMLLLPGIGGLEKGVNVLVTLRSGVMEKFGDLFYKLIG